MAQLCRALGLCIFCICTFFVFPASGQTIGVGFDGSNDYINISSNTNIPIGNSNYTIEAWIKPSSGGNYGIAGWGNYGTGNQVNAFRLGGATTLINYWWGNDLTVTVPNLADGSWHHVAATFDGTTRRIYTDGVLRGQDSPTGHAVSSASNLTLGRTWTAEYFPGGMDEVRIWNVARTATEIADNMSCDIAQDASLVAYYRFNHGLAAGTNTGLDKALDYSGNNNCGTLTNFALTGSSSNYITGAIGSCTSISLGTAITGTGTVCIGSTTTLSHGTSGGAWATGNAGVATVAAGVVTGVSVGTATISYIVCNAFATTVVTVNTGGIVITGNSALSTVMTTTLSCATSGGTWSSGATGVATVGSTTGVVSGVSAGTAVISYIITATGCFNTSVVTVNTPSAGLNFDGSNDHIVIGSVIPSASSYTKEVWVYPTSISGSRNIMSSLNAPFWITGGTLSAGQGGTYSVVTSGSFPANVWTHVAVTYDVATTTMRLYRNGIQVAVNTSAPSYTAESINIGSHNPGTSVFVGSMDEVRVWNVARTQAEIQANMNCDVSQQANLIAYYRFNEGTAGGTNTGLTISSDYSGNGNCGTIANFALTGGTSNFVTGAVGGCNTIALSSSITGVLSVCVGSSTSLSSGSTGGTWSSGATGVATVGTAGNVLGVSAGTAVITLNSCGSVATAVVTVYAVPAAITGNLNLTTAITTKLGNIGSTGTWVSSNTGVATVNSTTGVVTGVAVGSSVISYALGAGCAAVTTVNVLDRTTGLKFDGSNDYIISPNLYSAFGGNTVTVELWFNAAGAGVIVDEIGASGWHDSQIEILATGEVKVRVWNLSSVSLGTVPFNTWHHAALRYNSTTNVLDGVLDGVPSGSTVSGTRSVSSQQYYAFGLADGTHLGSGAYLNGTIDDVRIWKVARTNAEIRDNMNCDIAQNANLIAYYRFDEGTPNGTNTGIPSVRDFSGNTRCATFNNMARTGTNSNYVIGAVGNCNVISVSTSLSGTAEVCVGSTTTLTNATSGGVWSSASTGVATVSGGVVTGISGGTSVISYATCTFIATQVVTVNASPSVSAGSGVGVCAGSSTGLTASGAATYTWSPATGLSATTGASVTATPTVTTTYTVMGTNSLSCTNNASVTVSVTPLPDAGTLSGATNVNRGATIVLTSTVPGGTWSADNGNATVVGGTVTGVAGGTVTISYSFTNSCGTNVATKVVTINSMSSAVFGPAIICTGLSFTYSHPFTGGTWSSATPGVLSINETTGAATAVSAGEAVISYFADFTYVTKTVTVSATIPAITGSGTVCYGNPGVLGHVSEGGTWTSSFPWIATINASTGDLTSVASGVTFITYSLGTGCYAARLVTVNPLPGTITGVKIMCQGSTTTLGSATFYGAWTSSNTGIATAGTSSGIITGVSPGTATITYTATTGCLRTTEVTVNASIGSVSGDPAVCVGNTNSTLTGPVGGGTWSGSNPSVVTVHSITGLLTGMSTGTANITYTAAAGCYAVTVATVNGLASITGTGSMCIGATTTLADATPGGDWTSGNVTKATVSAGVVTGIAAGTAVITYAMSTGCYQTKTVTVNPLPSTINGTAFLCTGSTSTLTNTTSGGTWSSSTTSVATIGTSGLVTAISGGTSTISYVIGTGCLATTVVTVSLMPNTINGTGSMCVGNSTTLSSTTAGGAWSSYFTSIATVNGTTGVVTGVSSGTSIITYLLGSCYRTSVVTVNALPATISGDLVVCVGNTTSLSSATAGGLWFSSDVSKATINAATGVATGVAAGTTTITYSIGGCITTAVLTVNSLSGITGTGSVCVGNTTTLSHATSGGTWISGNTARATVGAGTGIVTGVGAGTVKISYTLSGACYQTLTVTVNPIPYSISGTASICEGTTTTLTSSTTGGVWSSSTPAVATIGGTGIVTAAGAGITTISYTSGTGCVATRDVTVNVNPDPITGTATLCIGNTTSLVSAPGGGVWTVGFTSRATINSSTGVATGVGAGNTNVTYTIGACRSIATLTVVASPSAITGVLILCNGSTTNLSSATFSGAWTSSDVTKATVGVATGVVTAVGVGTSTITYTVGGCNRTAEVTVNAAVGAVSGDAVVCVGQTNSTLAGPGGSGTWSSSSTAIASVHPGTGLLTGIGTGTATITYRLSTSCFATIVATVDAAVANIGGASFVCDGQTTTLTNATSGGAWSSSNTYKATVGAGTGVVSGIGAGTTTISYVVTTGCYKTKTMTVNSLPTPISGSATVVNGGTTTLTSISGGAWSSANAGVASIGAGTGVVTGVSLGATTITYAYGGTGCFVTRGITVVSSRPGSTVTSGDNVNILKVYPNPSSGSLTVDAPVSGSFSIFSIEGKQVASYMLHVSANTLSLPQDLAAGVYMCRFNGDDMSTVTVRLVLEK